MYKIYVDGQLLFSSDLIDDEHIVLSPMLSLGVNEAGSLSFVLPPGNVLHGSIHKIKSIITVEQDGEIIFRGRAMDDEKDFYNQKDVYCEGDRSFLLDSQCAPYTYSGTAKGLFEKLIAEHNEQVDDEKKFVIGDVLAVDDNVTIKKVENVAYWETLREMDDKLLSAYGGYIRTRQKDGTNYIDWLKQSGGTNSQVIEFSVNLLDLKDKVDAADVFTVLIPLGASEIGSDGEYSDPVSIKSVNDGIPYLVNEEAVNLYGKIWRTKTWNYEDSPAKLKEKGLEYLKTGIAVQTLTLKAVDMHFLDSSASAIRLGDYVRILSDPHGLDITLNCTKIDIDLLNPENTTYTFGEPPRTLTENVVKTEEDVGGMTGSSRGGGGGRSVKQEIKDYIRWADLRVDADEALITALTGQVDKHGERLSKAEVSIDGVNAQILLKASVDEVDALGRRVKSAELEIDGMNSQITLKADKIDLDGYVKADNLKSAIADISSLDVANIDASQGVSTEDFVIRGQFRFQGDGISKKEKSVISGGSCSIESTKKTVVDANDNPIGYVYVPTKVTFTPSGKETIEYLGY